MRPDTFAKLLLGIVAALGAGLLAAGLTALWFEWRDRRARGVTAPCSHPANDRVRWKMTPADDLDPETPVLRVCLCTSCGRTVPRQMSESPRQFDDKADKELLSAKWREWDIFDAFSRIGWPSRELVHPK